MKKIVKEELRPAYYPDDSEWRFKHEPWTKTPESNEIMEKLLEKLLDEFKKINSLDETDDTVFLVKWALWLGYTFKK